MADEQGKSKDIDSEIEKALVLERDYHQSSYEDAVGNIIQSMRADKEKVISIADKVYNRKKEEQDSVSILVPVQI